ncbi:MAG: response regulator [Nitrospinae bacterium]|nr:response regulator [Nitrospinota bacterium]
MGKVLIVDNASFMRSSLKYIVEKAGHEVVGIAVNGNEALKLYKELKPDVVTLDILMEGMDGLTALNNLKKDDPDAKVIMVTALGQTEKEDEAKKLGASGYIRKPFKVEDIVAEIGRVMGKGS